MSNDLFGMAVENRKSIKELIIVSSPRIAYHPLIEAARNFIPQLLFDNLHLISLDKTLINGLLVWKHCHMLFIDARWNRPAFLKHIGKFHGFELKERKPKPKTNPIKFTDTPITINLMEPDKELKVEPMESGESDTPILKVAEVETQVAAPVKTEEAAVADTQAVACTTTQGVRKSHHKKKNPIKRMPQPVAVPQCVDTIYDQKYIPSQPYPDISEDPNEWVIDWKAPLDRKPKTQKRKANATSSQSHPTRTR